MGSSNKTSRLFPNWPLKLCCMPPTHGQNVPTSNSGHKPSIMQSGYLIASLQSMLVSVQMSCGPKQDVLTKISTAFMFLAAQLRCPARRRRNTYDPAIRMQSLGSSLFINYWCSAHVRGHCKTRLDIHKFEQRLDDRPTNKKKILYTGQRQ